MEICVNRLKDLGLNKGAGESERVTPETGEGDGSHAGFEAELFNVHIDFPLFQRLAVPIPSGRSKIPGSKIHTPDGRLIEVLLHGGSQLGGWRMA